MSDAIKRAKRAAHATYTNPRERYADDPVSLFKIARFEAEDAKTIAAEYADLEAERDELCRLNLEARRKWGDDVERLDALAESHLELQASYDILRSYTTVEKCAKLESDNARLKEGLKRVVEAARGGNGPAEWATPNSLSLIAREALK